METTKINDYEISYLDKSEFNTIRREIFVEGIYEFSTKSENPLIIDVGAHIGLSIFYFKQLFPNSSIIAFEPDPKSFEMLQDNVSMNNLSSVELNNKAVLNKEGKTLFYIPLSEDKTWHSNSGVIPNAWNGKEKMKEIEVEVTSLEKYLDKEINLLKIDVEGAENRILKSLDGKFTNIENIIIEYHPQNKNRLKKITKLLKANGFELIFRQDSKVVPVLNGEELGIIYGKNVGF